VRLTEIARNAGTPAYLIDDARGLREEWFGKKGTGDRGQGTEVGSSTSLTRTLRNARRSTSGSSGLFPTSFAGPSGLWKSHCPLVNTGSTL
jgi:hypothetical protein